LNAQLRPQDPEDALPGDVAACVAFLREIGLSVSVLEAVGPGTFTPGIRIRAGSLEIDPTARASGLLHEAGHLATMPTRFRPLMEGNLYASVRRISMLASDLGLEPDHPLERALIQCGDTEATAWAWAAGCHIGLSPTAIIQDDEYEGEGAEIRGMLSMNAYFGISGMTHAGLCGHPRRPGGYPAMRKWLQDADA